ncbi:MAG: DUF488 family protein [Gammaproteobacteria bacterium]
MTAPAIWTIGHSTHSADAFLALLRAHEIGAIADVRRFPGSRRHPHFGREALQTNLVAAGIDYHWLPALGGRRAPRPDSRNTAWRNNAFRGYADYMETPEFAAAEAELERLAAERRTAIMCAEALWWQCHRALISDYLKARGIDVWHITGATAAAPHRFSSAGHVVDGRLTYHPPAGELKLS